MKHKCYIPIFALFFISTSYAYPTPKVNGTKLSFPFNKVGLNKRQATVHLLNRFTYGIKPGDIDKVMNMGLEKWFEKQLTIKQSEDALNDRIRDYDAFNMDDEGINNSFIPQYEIKRIMKSEGIFIADSNFEKLAYKPTIDSFMKIKNIRLPAEYQRQLINHKILSAVYSNNQLSEIMTDFWFNHFNVSLSKNQCALHILSYERDIIRPNVLGNFEDLLIATAKSPAMLEYLDNNYSVSFNNILSKLELNKKMNKAFEIQKNPMQDTSILKMLKQRKEQGLNENYARELLELHTLGVDGGYTQKDVTEVARIFTGWTAVPLLKYSDYRKTFEKARQYNIEKLGFIIDGNFLYRANRHDDSVKTVLNDKFPSKGGYQEGVYLLQKLAVNPATAKFICKKIATKFVSDNPPPGLVDKMMIAYLKSKGNIQQVLISMVNEPDFWEETAVRKKIKTPFELTISALRVTNAEVKYPYQLYNWCTNMGQKFYNYQAPTGFPDRSSYWVNTSSLLNRMNFGLALSANKLQGIKMDSSLINNNYEPESIDAAIKNLSELILPEVNSEINFNRVLKMVTGNEVNAKIEVATIKQTKMQSYEDSNNMDNANNNNLDFGNKIEMISVKDKNYKLSQIVGVLIGSPAFQKR